MCLRRVKSGARFAIAATFLSWPTWAQDGGAPAPSSESPVNGSSVPLDAVPESNTASSLSPFGHQPKEFQDAPYAPRMVVIPAGEFLMGSPASEPGRTDFEGPQHRVAISTAFAIGEYDITFEQWDACVAQGGCNGYRPDDNGWGRGSQPVINVNWYDAEAYVAWLSQKTGKHYRLPSEAEWEYAARAGSTTSYWWGPDASHDFANFGSDICCSGLAVGNDRWEATAPVGSFLANAFGVRDMNGEVMQFVQDCWHTNYNGAPTDGSAWEEKNCGFRALRGGAWNSIPAFVRSADRIWGAPQIRLNLVGFRVARAL